MRRSRFAALAFSKRFVGTLGSSLIALFLLVGLTGSVASADNRDVPAFPSDWKSNELKEHPLVGKIWSRAKMGFVSAQDFGTALARARYVLLGEVHDNADHHILQAWAIRTISKLRGARIVEGAAQMDVVAMEMLSSDQQKAIDKFYGRNARVPRQRTASDFGRLVKWDKSGWPDFKLYEPIIAEALRAHLVVTPGNTTRAENRKVAKEGLAAVGADVVRRLVLDKPLPEAVAADLTAEIRDSHCGMLPEGAIPGMVNVQRFRDARMADAMLVSKWKGAALIAGNGHVRRDRGAPWYLAQRGVLPEDVVIVRHIEVSDGKTALADYGLAKSDKNAAGGKGTAAASNDDVSGAVELSDFVVFTPRQSRLEPCEEMRRQMKAIRAHKSSKQDAVTPADAAKDAGKR